MPVTLADLRTRAKRRADQESMSLVGEAEWNTYINEAYHELWDLVAAAGGDHFLSSADFTLSGSTTTSALPADFYRLRGVDVDPGETTARAVRRFTWFERNDQAERSYRIMGGNIRIAPPSLAPGNYRIWYVPGATEMTADGNSISTLVERFGEFIVISAAMKALAKEESDTSQLLVEKQAIERRVKLMSNSRDDSEPERVIDVWATGPSDPAMEW